MQRYKVRCHDCDPEIIPHEAGKWVRWGDVERLRAELAECKQDAERYRWLRDDCGGFEVTVREENEDGGEEWIAGYSGPELDIAIDTARKGEGET